MAGEISRRALLGTFGGAVGATALAAGFVPIAFPQAEAAETPKKRRHWAMVIDMRKCDGCRTCTQACQETQKLPGWQSYQNSFQLDYDNAYTGWVSSITTDGYAKVVTYMNPEQQPVAASRPFPHIRFTITDGPAVMPAPAATQLFPTLPAKPVDSGIWTSLAGGIVGTPITLLGKALLANTDLELTWTTMVGNRSVTGFEERTKTIGTARTTAAGALSWALTIPDDLGGAHDITAKVGDRLVARTQLQVRANAFPLSVDRGPSGTKTVYDNSFSGYACAFQSSGDIEIFLTVSGDPGWHFIDMYPGIYQGTETRPANYKMPRPTSTRTTRVSRSRSSAGRSSSRTRQLLLSRCDAPRAGVHTGGRRVHLCAWHVTRRGDRAARASYAPLPDRGLTIGHEDVRMSISCVVEPSARRSSRSPPPSASWCCWAPGTSRSRPPMARR